MLNLNVFGRPWLTVVVIGVSVPPHLRPRTPSGPHPPVDLCDTGDVVANSPYEICLVAVGHLPADDLDAVEPS